MLLWAGPFPGKGTLDCVIWRRQAEHTHTCTHCSLLWAVETLRPCLLKLLALWLTSLPPWTITWNSESNQPFSL